MNKTIKSQIIVCTQDYKNSYKWMFTQVYMTQKNIKLFLNEKYSKPPKKNYATNKTDAHNIGDIWSLDILDLKDYGPENNRGYWYVLVIIENL